MIHCVVRKKLGRSFRRGGAEKGSGKCAFTKWTGTRVTNTTVWNRCLLAGHVEGIQTNFVEKKEKQKLLKFKLREMWCCQQIPEGGGGNV